MQDIASIDKERARAEVQIAAAQKAAGKLLKEAVKSEADRAQHAATLEAMKATFKVRMYLSSDHYSEDITGIRQMQSVSVSDDSKDPLLNFHKL